MSKPSCRRTRTELENITLGGLEPRPLDPETNARIIGPIIKRCPGTRPDMPERFKKQTNKPKNEAESEGKNVSLNIKICVKCKALNRSFSDLKFQVPYRATISEKRWLTLSLRPIYSDLLNSI